MTPEPQTFTRPDPRTLIGCNLRPGMVPGGFTEYFTEKSCHADRPAPRRESPDCMDVMRAATAWLDERSSRVMLDRGP